MAGADSVVPLRDHRRMVIDGSSADAANPPITPARRDQSGAEFSRLRAAQGVELSGVDPGRARACVRELYARPGLTVRDLTAPLLVQPDARRADTLPGSVALGEVGATVRRWADLGIRGVKVFAYGNPRDAVASAAAAEGNLMCAAARDV